MRETEGKWEAGRKLKRAERDRQKTGKDGNKYHLIGAGRSGGYSL